MSDLELHDKAWMAERIRKSEDWIAHNMARIPHIKIGKSVWFTQDDVDAFFAAHRVDAQVGRTAASRSRARKGRAA